MEALLITSLRISPSQRYRIRCALRTAVPASVWSHLPKLQFRSFMYDSPSLPLLVSLYVAGLRGYRACTRSVGVRRGLHSFLPPTNQLPSKVTPVTAELLLHRSVFPSCRHDGVSCSMCDSHPIPRRADLICDLDALPS